MPLRLASPARHLRPGQLLSQGLALPGLLLILLTLCSCRSTGWRPAERIHSDQVLSLYLERYRDDESDAVPQGLAHPIRVSEEQVAALLASLSFHEDRMIIEDREDHLFPSELIWQLAGPLAEGLGRLGPDERLRFLVHRPERHLVFMSIYLTSGVLFSAEPGRLDIALDTIEERRLPDDFDRDSHRFYRKPTRITSSDFRLQGPEGLTRVPRTDSPEPHPLWARIPLDRLDGLVARARESQEAAKPTPASAPRPEPGPAPSPRPEPAPRPEPEVVQDAPPAPAPGPVEKPSPGTSITSILIYRGCNVYRSGQRYYGLPAGAGPFDREKFEKGAYRLAFQGDSLREVTSRIDEAAEAGLLPPVRDD